MRDSITPPTSSDCATSLPLPEWVGLRLSSYVAAAGLGAFGAVQNVDGAIVYTDVPDVTIYGDRDFAFSYVPAYLHHILFELLKNSMRAVVENHRDDPSGRLPP